MLKDRKGSLIGESDVITLCCQPFQRLRDLSLSFNTNQKPRIKYPKSGDFENKNYIGRSPDPFSSRPNIKEEKAVWLRETKQILEFHRKEARLGIVRCSRNTLSLMPAYEAD